MSENGQITWTNETRKLRDLVPWENNPREIHKAEADRLGESLRLFGQIQAIAIDPDNGILDGHQRRLVWSVLPTVGPDYEVDVRVSSRALTEQERQQLVVYLHRGTNARWDFDILANSFEVSDLLDWGFSEDELQLDWGEEDDGNYSRKIEAPTYQPAGKKPSLDVLFDDEKTRVLLEEIEQDENISNEEKSFLRIAAQRHTVLHFKRIADYYAQSSAEIQNLMENSALVIIDFDKAISLGYVNLTKQIAELVRDEYGDDE